MSDPITNDYSKPAKSEGCWELPRWPKIELPKEMKEDIRQAFMLFDETGEGIIGMNDVQVAIRALGFDIEPLELKKLSQKTRFDDDQVDFENFLDLISDRMLAFDSPMDIRKCFELLDTADKGHVDLDDLRVAAVGGLGEAGVTDDQLAALLVGAQAGDPGDTLRRQFDERQAEARQRRRRGTDAEAPADPTAPRARRVSSSGQQRPETLTVTFEQFENIMTINRPLVHDIQML